MWKGYKCFTTKINKTQKKTVTQKMRNKKVEGVWKRNSKTTEVSPYQSYFDRKQITLPNPDRDWPSSLGENTTRLQPSLERHASPRTEVLPHSTVHAFCPLHDFLSTFPLAYSTASTVTCAHRTRPSTPLSSVRLPLNSSLLAVPPWGTRKLYADHRLRGEGVGTRPSHCARAGCLQETLSLSFQRLYPYKQEAKESRAAVLIPDKMNSKSKPVTRD